MGWDSARRVLPPQPPEPAGAVSVCPRCADAAWRLAPAEGRGQARHGWTGQHVACHACLLSPTLPPLLLLPPPTRTRRTLAGRPTPTQRLSSSQPRPSARSRVRPRLLHQGRQPLPCSALRRLRNRCPLLPLPPSKRALAPPSPPRPLTLPRPPGTAPAVKAIHAGLECGIIGEKLPGLDCVSFGPTIT